MPSAPSGRPAPADLQALLDVAPVALALWHPRYGPDGAAVADFAVAYLNPAGRELLGRPERPDEPLAALFPNARESGLLAFCGRVFATGEPDQFEASRGAEGREARYSVAAQRRGELLATSFAAMAGEPAGPAVAALRASRAAEAAARVDAAQQRATLVRYLGRTHAAICVLRGPDQALDYCNPTFERLFSGRPLPPGTPLAEMLPEGVKLGLAARLRRVYRTGTSYFGAEWPLAIEPTGGHPARHHYFTFSFDAYQEQGRTAGVSIFAYDVTEAVLARRQNEALQAEALAAAQRRVQERDTFHQVFAHTPAAICLLRGAEHRFAYLNQAYQALFPGLGLTGRSVAEALPEAVAQGFVALLDGVYQTGKSFFGPEAPLQLAGQDVPRYYAFTYQRFEENGQPAGISVFGTDTTEQVLARQEREARRDQQLAAAERQAQERETPYRLFAQTPALIVLLRGPEHRIDYHNAAYQQLFPGRVLRGRPVAEAVPEAERQGFGALLNRVYETGETHFGVEVPFVAEPPGGAPEAVRYFNFTFQRFEENGQPAGVSEFAYDVTEQVLARRDRESQQRQLQELFMQAPAPIVVLGGPDLVFQLVNPAYQQIFPGRKLAGKPLLEALPELVGTAIPDLLRRVYETGEPYADQEMPLLMARHEGGPLEEIYWTFSYQARRDAHGAIDGVRVFAHDVTAPVRTRQQALASAQQVLALNDELTATNRQLVRTNADLDTFVYTASHDLKTPVANIEGLLLALQDELPPAVRQTGAVQPMLDQMQGAVERFQLTIAQLTDVARLQQAQAPPAETVDLAALVADLRLDLAPLLATTSARLTLDVAACPEVSFAPQLLRSIVYNLLSNAVKYRHPDRSPHVQLRCRSTAAHVVLEVEDNGLGLTEAQQGQLFGLFRRLHDHVEGSGLGLYVVKQLVVNAGGTVFVESQAGVGSTFTVVLPRATGGGGQQ